MAKNKDVNGKDIEPVNMEGIQPAGQVDSELAAAKAELESAKARIAELEKEKAIEAETAVTGDPRLFLVSLKHAPSWVVSATDKANAWEAYRQATGVIASEYQPEIVPTELPLGRAAV